MRAAPTAGPSQWRAPPRTGISTTESGTVVENGSGTVARVAAGPADRAVVETDGRKHEREGEGEKTKQSAARALAREDGGADAAAQQGAHDGGQGGGGEERHAEARRERGHRVHAG